MTLSVLREFYLKIKTASGIAENTYIYYDKTSLMFLDFVGHDLPCSALTYDHVTDYLEYLRTIPTINTISIQTYAR